MKPSRHVWHLWRFGYGVCDKCGLVLLKNRASQAAARKACPGPEGDDQ